MIPECGRQLGKAAQVAVQGRRLALLLAEQDLVADEVEDHFGVVGQLRLPGQVGLDSQAFAALTSDLWTMKVEQLDGLDCADGSTARLTNIFAFTAPDPNGSPNLTGTHTRIHGAVCGMQPAMTKTPFTLTFTDVLDPGVIHRFPMICDYLAGRPSICS